jgi:hypothetical protein
MSMPRAIPVVWLANVRRHRHAIQVKPWSRAPDIHHKVDTLIYIHNIERVKSASWRQSRWRSRKKAIGLSPSPEAGFITPRQLLPRYLDSSPEKVQKLVLKPVLYCWCQLWFFTSMSCGRYTLCSTAQRHGSARAELSSRGVPRQCLQSSETVQLHL